MLLDVKIRRFLSEELAIFVRLVVSLVLVNSVIPVCMPSHIGQLKSVEEQMIKRFRIHIEYMSNILVDSSTHCAARHSGTSAPN